MYSNIDEKKIFRLEMNDIFDQCHSKIQLVWGLPKMFEYFFALKSANLKVTISYDARVVQEPRTYTPFELERQIGASFCKL